MSRLPLDPDLARALQAIQDTFGADQARVVAVAPTSPCTAPPAAPAPAAPAAEQASLLDPEQQNPHAAAGSILSGPAGEVRADA